MSYKIEISEDMIDTIVVEQLATSRQQFLNDLGANSNVFVWDDQEEDDKEIQKHIDAIDTVISWYATESQLKNIYGTGKNES
jgi:uncharacterized protein with ACT and thioredoxin-like domain